MEPPAQDPAVQAPAAQELPRTSREEAKRQTRQRLLQAGLALLAEEGPEALTTGKVAKRAGMAQPTFYVHFKDMDALLQALARDQVGGLREQLRQLRLQISRAGSVPMELVRETYRAPLSLLVAQGGDLLRLLLSEMHRPHTTLGHATRQLVDEVINDLFEDVTTLGLGGALPPERLRLLCEGMIMLTIHYGLGLVEGRHHDLEMVADVLTQQTIAMMMVNVGWQK